MDTECKALLNLRDTYMNNWDKLVPKFMQDSPHMCSACVEEHVIVMPVYRDILALRDCNTRQATEIESMRHKENSDFCKYMNNIKQIDELRAELRKTKKEKQDLQTEATELQEKTSKLQQEILESRKETQKLIDDRYALMAKIRGLLV